jgi:hypothetical protein
MVAQKLCISGDSHVVEAAEVFAGLEERFGEDAPKVIRHPEYGDTLVIPGRPVRPNFGVGRLGIAGHYANDPATIELIRRGYDGLRPGVMDPVARLKDQEIDGIDAEVLYPSLLFGVYGIPNKDAVRRHSRTTTTGRRTMRRRRRTGCSRWPASRCTTSTRRLRSWSERASWDTAAVASPVSRRPTNLTQITTTIDSGRQRRR